MNDFESLSHVDSDHSEVFSRSVRISLLGTGLQRPSSFLPDSLDALPNQWAEWCNSPFETILGPALREAINLGQSMQLRELVVIDEALKKSLADASKASIRASKPFIQSKENMRGHREWSKYIDKIDQGQAPGHLPIVFGLHAVLFKIPLAIALQTYAWAEWKAGHWAIEQSRLAGHPESPSPLFMIVTEPISRILAPSSETDVPELRAI